MHGSWSSVRANRPVLVAGKDVTRLQALRQLVKVEIHDRGGEKSEHLRQDEAANDGDAQRLAQLGAHASSQGQRQTAQHRRHCSHQDGAEAQQAGLVDGLFSSFVEEALGLQRKVDHHDGVLLHDADQ